MERRAEGSAQEFDKSWRERPEAGYLHWTRTEPTNQVQLAFRKHWECFQELMSKLWPHRTLQDLRALEVGSGRGTMSMYFADAGFDCHLLDSSATVLFSASEVFERHGLRAHQVTGDALCLPFASGSFDIVFSMGLLEHFEDLDLVLSEQVRVLDSDGIFLAYVVPHNPANLQSEYEWINDMIRDYILDAGETLPTKKEDLFRNSYDSKPYLEKLSLLGMDNIGSRGVYPLPMISPSPEFPFTLNPPSVERTLVRHFSQVLDRRGKEEGVNGWYCDEGYGQAFLLWAHRSRG